tara:strand:- start:166 stop:333 length:168 start_codon:yes stop_codon:yes gene_type:complete
MNYHVAEEGAMCDDCGVVYLENGSFNARSVEWGRICVDCYDRFTKEYPELEGVSF